MKKISIVLSAILIYTGVQAQVLEQLSPQEKKQLTRVTEPLTLYKGFLRTGVSFNYYAYDKFFDENGDKIFYESNISSFGLNINFSVLYGITDRLEMEALLPYSLAKTFGSYSYELPSSNEFVTDRSVMKASGLSDMVTVLRYQVVTENQSRPAVTFGLGAILPTGKKEVSDYIDAQNYKGATGRGEYGMISEFKVRKVRYPFSYEFNAGMLNFFGAEKLISPDEPRVNVTSGSELFFRPQISFHLNEWISLTHYVDYYRALKDKFTGDDVLGTHNNEYAQWVMRYTPAFTMQVNRLRLEQVVQIPLAGKSFAADPYFYFNVQYIF